MRIEENDTQLIAYFSGDENVMSYVAWFFCGFLFIDVLDMKRAVIHWDGLLVLIVWLLVVAAVWRVNHCSINGRFVFDRQERVLHTIQPAFWGRQESVHSLPLGHFEGIQSYILQTPSISWDRHNPDWEMNVLEFVTPEPIRGVVFHRFPPVVNKLGAFKKERLENPDAALLAQRLSQFLGLVNHGFVGEKQRTALLAVHDPEKTV